MTINSMSLYAGKGYADGPMGALARGLRGHNVEVEVLARGQPSRKDAVCAWGWRLGRYFYPKKQTLIMERAYLGDRFAWYSLGWNGLNGRGKFPVIDDDRRFAQHFGHLMQPWKDDGDYVLLIGQVPGDMSIEGVAINHWYKTTAERARKAYGLPVMFREHPVARSRGIKVYVPGVTSMLGTLADALKRAAVCITYNSNTGVESVLAGVPTVTADVGSMAYAVTSHTVGEIVKPDRGQWAARLAWCQWTADEMASGEAWTAVGQLCS